MIVTAGINAPWDSRRRLRLLRDNWLTLRNQVLGRGVAPRDDISPEAQQQIITTFNDFETWYEGIQDSFLSDMFGAYGSTWRGESELDGRIQQYNLAVELAARTVPEPVATCMLPTHEGEGSVWPYVAVAAGAAIATLSVQLLIRGWTGSFWRSRARRVRSR